MPFGAFCGLADIDLRLIVPLQDAGKHDHLQGKRRRAAVLCLCRIEQVFPYGGARLLRAVCRKVPACRQDDQSVRVGIRAAYGKHTGPAAALVQTRRVLERERVFYVVRQLFVEVPVIVPQRVHRRLGQCVRNEYDALRQRADGGAAFGIVRFALVKRAGAPDFVPSLYEFGDLAVGVLLRADERRHDFAEIGVRQNVANFCQRQIHQTQRADRMQAHDLLLRIVAVSRPFVGFARLDEPDPVVMPQCFRRRAGYLRRLFDRIQFVHKNYYGIFVFFLDFCVTQRFILSITRKSGRVKQIQEVFSI